MVSKLLLVIKLMSFAKEGRTVHDRSVWRFLSTDFLSAFYIVDFTTCGVSGSLDFLAVLCERTAMCVCACLWCKKDGWAWGGCARFDVFSFALRKVGKRTMPPTNHPVLRMTTVNCVLYIHIYIQSSAGKQFRGWIVGREVVVSNYRCVHIYYIHRHIWRQ